MSVFWQGRHNVLSIPASGLTGSLALVCWTLASSAGAPLPERSAMAFFLNKVLRYSIAYEFELTGKPGLESQQSYVLPTGERLRHGFYRFGADGSVINEIDDLYWLNTTKRIRNDVWEKIEANDQILTYSAVNKELDDSGSSLLIVFNFTSGSCQISMQEMHYDILFGTSRASHVTALLCVLQ
jgi:hypothetical protein